MYLRNANTKYFSKYCSGNILRASRVWWEKSMLQMSHHKTMLNSWFLCSVQASSVDPTWQINKGKKKCWAWPTFAGSWSSARENCCYMGPWNILSTEHCSFYFLRFLKNFTEDHALQCSKRGLYLLFPSSWSFLWTLWVL